MLELLLCVLLLRVCETWRVGDPLLWHSEQFQEVSDDFLQLRTLSYEAYPTQVHKAALISHLLLPHDTFHAQLVACVLT